MREQIGIDAVCDCPPPPKWGDRHLSIADRGVTLRGAAVYDAAAAWSRGSLRDPQPSVASALDDAALRSNPKEAVSAHRVRQRLDARHAPNIVVDDWQEFERDDAIVAEEVVAEQWDFWSSRV